MNETVLLYILVMAGVTYLIRLLPLVLIRGEITGRFIRSFLYYVPFVTLALMIFPSVLGSTAHSESALAGTCVAITTALFGAGLFRVTLAACGTVFAVDLLFF